ncbi:MAG: helix-turn-helix domain-containing protein [Actinomycetota bacterium]|nr:helix-turn-helix domain-containing protein [Actinomycetota bacterium]
MTDEVTAKTVARALGEELRRAREARGWSRAYFVKRLPSGIGDRTLLAYEHGVRQMTMLRLLELAQALEVPASVIVAQALQQARLYLQNITVRVDLRQVLEQTNVHYRPLVPWARNRLLGAPDGVIEVSPHLFIYIYAVMGRTHREMSAYLAQFIPDHADMGEVEVVPV